MYVVFEGIDCIGKSTQISLLKPYFKEAVFTMEPGGSEFGTYLRKFLLHENGIGKKTELLLFLADRAEHYEEILKKNQDKLIISDRSFISGIAYTKNIFDIDLLFKLNAFVLNNFFPQKIIFLKGDEKLMKKRLGERKLDSIEKRGIGYFLEVQEEFEYVLNFLSKKIAFELLVVDARDTRENMHEKIKEFLP